MSSKSGEKDQKSKKSKKPDYEQTNVLNYIFRGKTGFILFDQKDDAISSTVSVFKKEEDVYEYILKSYEIPEYVIYTNEQIGGYSCLEMSHKHGDLKFYVNFKTKWDKIVKLVYRDDS
jgi:hypothetical protein